jgi:Zn-dependent alcohol dehydrogenase
MPECPIVCYVATTMMPLADINKTFERMKKDESIRSVVTL